MKANMKTKAKILFPAMNSATFSNRTRLFVRRYRAAWLLLVMSTFLPRPVLADQEGDFQFQIVGGEVEITAYIGPGGSVVIPDHLGGVPVKAISRVFSGNISITSVTIPNSVTGVACGAFTGCTGLTNISLGTGLADIANPRDPMTTGIPPTGVFQDCTGLKSITIPNSVTFIGSRAFSGCTGLTSIVIPNNVIGIGLDAFYGCTGLTNVTVGDGLDGFGYEPFGGCTSLKSIEVAEANTNLSSSGGVVYDKALSVLLFCPPGKDGAYTIPDSVGSIRYGAFAEANHLTTIAIGARLTDIPPGTFSPSVDCCASLLAFEVSQANPAYSSLEGVLFDKAQALLLQYPPGKAGPYIIPTSVTSVSERRV
jgi:hypothetical protein